jgi:ribonuclease HII
MLKSYYIKNRSEAGCDEAGRGCLAGPVFAAAVILPGDYYHPVMNDSKQLSPKQREVLRSEIEKEALAWAIAISGAEEIDQINILNASFLAMHRAIEKMTMKPQHLIIDGNRFRSFRDIPHTCIIKGDGLYFSIAAASILAKTYRDDYMAALHKEYPYYGWASNKGYPTKAHRLAIQKYGVTKYHRKTFRLLDEHCCPV